MRSLISTFHRDVVATDCVSNTDLDTEKRNVRALLIAGDQVGSPGTPTPGATASLDIIEQDLRARFSRDGVQIARLVVGPTRQRVDHAFDAMKGSLGADDLFIVMFAGHGRSVSGPHGAQAWSLTGDDVFSDVDLATTLRALPPCTDTVVISDCCYGEGLFRVADLGHRDPERSPRNIPMVCISGAGATGLIELTKLVSLAKEIVAAAGAGHSYSQLSGTFAATAVAGRTFHVDARPTSRLGDRVLATAGRVRELGLTPAAVAPAR